MECLVWSVCCTVQQMSWKADEMDLNSLRKAVCQSILALNKEPLSSLDSIQKIENGLRESFLEYLVWSFCCIVQQRFWNADEMDQNPVRKAVCQSIHALNKELLSSLDSIQKIVCSFCCVVQHRPWIADEMDLNPLCKAARQRSFLQPPLLDPFCPTQTSCIRVKHAPFRPTSWITAVDSGYWYEDETHIWSQQ